MSESLMRVITTGGLHRRVRAGELEGRLCMPGWHKRIFFEIRFEIMWLQKEGISRNFDRNKVANKNNSAGVGGSSASSSAGPRIQVYTYESYVSPGTFEFIKHHGLPRWGHGPHECVPYVSGGDSEEGADKLNTDTGLVRA